MLRLRFPHLINFLHFWNCLSVISWFGLLYIFQIHFECTAHEARFFCITMNIDFSHSKGILSVLYIMLYKSIRCCKVTFSINLVVSVNTSSGPEALPFLVFLMASFTFSLIILIAFPSMSLSCSFILIGWCPFLIFQWLPLFDYSCKFFHIFTDCMYRE